MFTIGYGTVILYCISMTFYLLGMVYPDFFVAGVGLGTIFFVIPSIIIGIMMKKRIET